ncbi:MAG: hypothetical protein PHF60_01965 [Candidatus ainarchaeum sp.]|nr:hypothetical protein [Candidatus ainarchaeum sp.]
MRHALLFALMALVILTAGCLSPPQSFGCCLRANATAQDPAGCVLYNTTDYQEYPEYFEDTVSCDAQTGCNVSVGGAYHQLPICTDDQLVPCIEPNCTAMVCGDFAFKPRPAPGFTDVDSSAGDAPPDLGDETGTLQFYKAQCRFLPMDSQLKQVMKASKSQINVFRMGAGNSFDEYDQYRYFFPISDQYCSLSLASGVVETGKVDRYMNYVTPDGSDYVPVGPTAQITENCLDDTSSTPGTDSPFGFQDYAGPLPYNFEGMWGNYVPILPDKSDYKFTYKARMDSSASWDDDLDAYTYDSLYVDYPGGIYKKIDQSYYRKTLAISHLEHIYGLDDGGGGRASFECDSASSDCYSGVCSTDVYSRGVLLEEAGGGTYSEVVTDCNQVNDNMGFATVVCSPTKNVTPNGNNPPTMGNAGLSVKPFHITLSSVYDSPFMDYNDVQEDEKDDANEPLNKLFIAWDTLGDIYDNGDSATGDSRGAYTEVTYDENGTAHYTSKSWTNTAAEVRYTWEDCEDDGDEWCDHVVPETKAPPAGGVVFFGKVGDTFVNYDGSDIIGYATTTEEEFQDTLFYKNCGLTEDDYIMVGLVTQTQWIPGFTTCEADEDCICFACEDSRCTDGHCEAKVAVTVTPDSSRWKDLQAAFRPYFLRYVQNGLAATNFGEDGCGDKVEALDVVFAAMPWVINFEKGYEFDDELYPTSYQMTSASAQAIRERNIYDQNMTSVPGTASCELRRAAGVMGGIWEFIITDGEYYNVLSSSYVVLIKKPEDGKLGKCVVDSEGTGLPKVRTFGWCEPCTTSTLAYQNITAKDGVYLPVYSADIGSVVAKNVESLCNVTYKIEWEDGIAYNDNVSCFNEHITDVSDYRDSLGDIGSPRTEPEATILKERLGEYLKAGVLPVLDMSDESNWVMDNPETDGMFLQYDFQNLFGNMGAVVVIVDHVSSEADIYKAEEIVNRTTTVRSFCPRCLTAIHVDGPSSNDSFRTIIGSVTGDPRANANLDMVTFDYSVSDHSGAYDSVEGLENKSQAIVEDMASYGAASLSLQTKGKPTMVVGFSVDDNDPVWKDKDSYMKLFQGIVLSQKKLVKAGVTGIIYAPVSTTTTDADGSGLVDRKLSVQGMKTPKFCAYESALQMMSMSPPIAMFTKVPAWTTPVECVECSALDTALGVCGEGADPSPMLCDDGTECVLAAPYLLGDEPTNLKCPDKTVTQDCPVCSGIGGEYICTLTYPNGTLQTINGSMSEVDSDIYMDVVAGMSSPNKCCLVAGEGEFSGKYTYMKDVHQTPIAQPIAFSKAGDPNMDCGMSTDTDALSGISEFCGLPAIPLRSYDINCSVD